MQSVNRMTDTGMGSPSLTIYGLVPSFVTQGPLAGTGDLLLTFVQFCVVGCDKFANVALKRTCFHNIV